MSDVDSRISRELAYKSKQRKIKTVKNFLDRNNISYELTKNENIVAIKTLSQTIILSLVPTVAIDLKVRFKGDSKWYIYTKTSFLKMLNDKNKHE